MPKSAIIAVDFDGTCVKHEYPNIGEDVPFAVEYLRRLTDHGHRIILNTMRSGEELDAAVQWFKARGIPLYGVNANPTQKQWTTSPKVYAEVYIDDAALGCPLVFGDTLRPYVDWSAVWELLFYKDIRVN